MHNGTKDWNESLKFFFSKDIYVLTSVLALLYVVHLEAKDQRLLDYPVGQPQGWCAASSYSISENLLMRKHFFVFKG